VREEFAAVDDATFTPARAHLLHSLLASPSLFATRPGSGCRNAGPETTWSAASRDSPRPKEL
jgi:predicted metal-dependent HD superfamily phosphohydrolase